MSAFPSEVLAWVREGFQAEYVSDLGPSYVLHVRGGRKTPGKFVHRVARILDGNHILWTIERDLDTPGDWRGRGLRPKRDGNGEVIRHAEEWLQPYHEAVKRLLPRGETYMSIRYYWFAAYLADRGLPCLCAHRSLIDHLARTSWAFSRGGATTFSEAQVKAGIERTAREVARLIGDRVPENPIARLDARTHNMAASHAREHGDDLRRGGVRPTMAAGSNRA